MAFATWRSDGGTALAERTIFIGVPDLEPIPVGKVSTALWATRANFQAGLFNEGGIEITFTDLHQVKELVRRGYLAGGIGPGPAAPPIEPPPEPDRRGPFLGEQLEQALFELQRRRQTRYTSEGIWDPKLRKEAFMAIATSEEIFSYLQTFAAATIVEWHRQIADRYDADEEALAQWMDALVWRAGLWESPHDCFESIVMFDGDGPWFEPYFYPYRDRWFASPDYWDDLLLEIPCPLLPAWDRRIKRLADKLFLATSTADYFAFNPDLPELIPSLLAALTVTSLSAGARSRWSERLRRSRLEAALAWLSAQMPQTQLPPVAENALSAFAWSELNHR
jgi:hypothetical protein